MGEIVDNDEYKYFIDNNKNIIKSYIEEKKFIDENGINISTMTLHCSIGVDVNLVLFAKYVDLVANCIEDVKFGDRKNPASNRTIINYLKKKKKKSTKNFYNQVTVLMKPQNNPTRNYINIKVFKNGSIHMTGCKDINDFKDVATKLISIILDGKVIIDSSGNTKKINFIVSTSDIDKIGIYNLKINMINSDFKMGYKIDRKKLYTILKKNHGNNTLDDEIGYVECKFNPSTGHSCVNIKYYFTDEIKISVFVFQTGSIIITGAKSYPQIIQAYLFIMKIFNKYINDIKIIEISKDEFLSKFMEYLATKAKPGENISSMVSKNYFMDKNKKNSCNNKKNTKQKKNKPQKVIHKKKNMFDYQTKKTTNKI